MDTETHDEDLVRENHCLSMTFIFQSSYLFAKTTTTATGSRLKSSVTHGRYRCSMFTPAHIFVFFALLGRPAAVFSSLPRFFCPPRPPDLRLERAEAR